jgi:hypothetical protein
MHYFLELDDLPGNQKEKLKTLVKSDLQKINDLISEYEKIDFIKKNETPRNHQQRTENDFYKRCLEERDKIQTHLKKGIKSRALVKASRYKISSFIESWFEGFYDRPYKIPMPKSNEFFDNENIDKVGHRIGDFPISKGMELKKIYEKDKQKFYDELQKLIPVEKELDYLVSQVKFLPYIPEQRVQIFEELIDLYKTKKWFGFYALALTQIEGLFTEMCQMCQPEYKNNKASLSDKAELVRPFHPVSENKFDYFQYYLPTLRNRFLHYGIDQNEKIKILCNDILYDLDEVISIFASLTIDANWLLRLVRKRDVTEFMSIKGLCFYFKMLRSVKAQNQFHFFESEVKSLNENFLPDVVFNVVYNLDNELKSLLDIVSPVIKMQSAKNGYEVDLDKTMIKTLNENPKEIKRCLNETFNCKVKSEVEELLLVHQFFKTYRQNIDLNFIAEDVKNTIDIISKKYSLVLNKIKVISIHTGINNNNGM